jgi:TolB protein
MLRQMHDGFGGIAVPKLFTIKVAGGLLLAALATASLAQERSEHRPVLSPDETQIVFMSRSTEMGDDWELFLMDADGRNLRRLTDHLGWDGYATWSPDGRTLVFDRSLDGGNDNKALFRLDLESGEAERLYAHEGWVSASEWRGTELLGFWEHDGQRDIYAIGEDGTLLRQLTDTPDITESDAIYSRNAYAVYFVSAPAGGGATRLERLDLAGGARTTLRESTGRMYGLALSPDGSRIAFTDAPGGEDNNADIFVLDLETGAAEAMTTDDGWDHMPVWIAGGEAIMFTSYRSGTEHIYVTHGPGTAMRLWAGDGED